MNQQQQQPNLSINNLVKTIKTNNSESQTEITINPTADTNNITTSEWKEIIDNHLNTHQDSNTTNTKNNNNIELIETNSQTKISFIQNESIKLNQYKIEFQRKLRYENHVNILTAHTNNNTTPEILNESNFPAALINTDIIMQKRRSEIIKMTIERLKEILIEED